MVNEDLPTSVEVSRVTLDGDRRVTGTASVAHESPLALQVDGVPVSVVMRTPGADEELALGMLLTEGVITSMDQVHSIRPCAQDDDDAAGGRTISARLRGSGVLEAVERMRRVTLTGSSCGVCGRRTIEDLLDRLPALDPLGPALEPEVIVRVAAALAGQQPIFERTGGLHAVGLFDAGGSPLVIYEDVGRHNAVDKVIGWRLREGDTRGVILMVSGRVSFEIVQKALRAGLPVVAAISAPTSLAVDLAVESHMTLIGFVRGSVMSVYAGASRFGVGGDAGETGRPTPRVFEVGD